eukprot:CAMPEP_0197019500 /NCGR_PEP_ID=MMETSP1380-20130617/80737_1 /TAXON_ID=5936 /ORGANISM="Euplotes crassus, Strain CT5" /LENGTH=492 /DNA_ID=CAMNT_0042446935 /DNA_START=802 /DNA_END=2281 /DNA_ORIENTATION=+
MKEINTDAAKTDLDHQFISLTVESKLPPKHLLTTKKDRIVRNKLNDQPARDGKSQQKSARRDRKERMRSSHSQNRVTSTQNIPTKNTYVTKESKSKAVPKICGNNKDSFQEAENDTGKDRIKEMLRKIDSLEESSINLHKTEISEKYMLPHAKKYQVFKKSERLNYGPLLSKNPASGKNSFIENNKMKLQVTRDAQDPSRKKKETLNHIVSQESLNSNYFQRSGFSGQNTTASDKNSEQEKNQTKKEESNNYYSSINFLGSNAGTNSQSTDVLKRGRSVEMRRGRASRNKERIRKTGSKKEDSNLNRLNQNNSKKQKVSDNFNFSQDKIGKNYECYPKSALKTRFRPRKGGIPKPNRAKNLRTMENSLDKDTGRNEEKCSNTFIKSSYKISGSGKYEKYKKQVTDQKSIKTFSVVNLSQKDTMKSFKTRMNYSRKSLTKENSNRENTSDEQAKLNYLKRKKEYENGGRTIQSKKHSVYKTNANLTHRKAISY